MQQDNPQQAAAYVAGFMDGESGIRIQHMKSRGPAQFVPQVKISQVTREVLEYVQSLYRGWIRSYQPSSASGNARTTFEWCLQGREAVLKLMNDVQPYCIVKRAHVLLMIRFITEGEVTTPPTPISQQEIERRRGIFEQFKLLNLRGVQLQRLSAPTSKEDATVRSAGTVQPAEITRNGDPPSKEGQ